MKMVGKRLLPDTFAHFTERLQAHGRYTFTKKEVIKELGISDNAFRKAAFRLSKQKRLMRLVNNFYVVIPFEYHLSGGPPATSYIDDLMKFHKQPYYVGVLSAASLHGAAHQAPQELQVVTSTPLRIIHAGRSRIRFLTKKRIEKTPTQLMKTPAGYISVSTPEATAYDLFLYARNAGYLNNIATVLIELSEVINPQKLLELAKNGVDMSTVRRVGYLLDQYAREKCTGPLYKWIKGQDSAFVLLQPNHKSTFEERNEKWRIIVNEKVEPDL
jgi:predicted transcriptional regulator of viral defense system